MHVFEMLQMHHFMLQFTIHIIKKKKKIVYPHYPLYYFNNIDLQSFSKVYPKGMTLLNCHY